MGEQMESNHVTEEMPHVLTHHDDSVPKPEAVEKLDNPSIARYSRQLILPQIGVQGQLKLAQTSVLIVGAGGLGCPAAIYLTAAGIGRLGLVDFDEVELNNLHRQILHTEHRVGVSKAASAAHSCNKLNSRVICIPYHLSLNSQNALSIVSGYDIVVDATDNVATRYLLNDACVLANKPLVSGSALRFEGQLTVYNYKGGPCYRCLYPKPPPPETVTNCADGGVLGVVPGIIGSLEALEAIKIASGMEPNYAQKLLLFDALDGSFRNIKLRTRQTNCVVCGDNPSVTQLIDYEQFCGSRATDKTKNISIVAESDRITVKDYKAVCDERRPHILVDVRLPVELEICTLPNVLNIPIDCILKEEYVVKLKEQVETCRQSAHSDGPVKVYLLCHLGNDSQRALPVLREQLKGLPVTVQDICGGLDAWARQIDKQFPIY